MTLSKETLEEIAELARKATYKPCAMHITNLVARCDSEVVEELIRELLERRERDKQEPVFVAGFDAATAIRACMDEFPDSVHDIVEECAQIAENTISSLHAAPQAPVVPECLANAFIAAIEKEQDRLHDEDYLMDSRDCIDVIREELQRLNDCRAAMHGTTISNSADIAIDEASHVTAPIVPDANYQQLSELYHAQEKRLFKIAQRIKGPSFDKYAYSPSQAIDVLEVAIFGESNDDGSAAALNHTHGKQPASNGVQSFGNSEQLNSPVVPDGGRNE